MKGYYRDDSMTADAIRDGWLHTGDLGFIDTENNLTITGRSKDVIVLANGKNIYPEEIETHYGKSPFIKEICVTGVLGSDGEVLHGIVVPDMDEFRRRSQSAVMEMIRFEIENLSKALPSYQRVLSISIRNQPLPRTATRKLKRFEIQAEEEQRANSLNAQEVVTNDSRFESGTGRIVAALIRRAKPEITSLQPSMSLELDLGFDSLARVELLSEIESETGAHIADDEASRIYTVGELLEVIEKKESGPMTSGRGWREILNSRNSGGSSEHYIFEHKPFATATLVVLSRIMFWLSRVLLGLRWQGLENIPKTGPLLICPNHQSFLDAPVLYALLPANVIGKTFSLGYSDYWEGRISRWVAKTCNIVAIDPNINLVRAMQVGAAGLKRNKRLLVFPEGTRSIDGHVAEFKKGAAILSYELGVPILPVGINGTFHVWPRGGQLRLHRPVEVVFGQLIDPQQFSHLTDPYTALIDHLRVVVKALSRDS